MYNVMNVNLTSTYDVDQALEFHLGQIGLYCGCADALRYTSGVAEAVAFI